MTRRDFLITGGVTAMAVTQARYDQTGSGVAAAASEPAPNLWSSTTLLSDGWLIQSSEVVKGKGDGYSSPDYMPHKWIPASVPSTILAALVASGEYPELFTGENLKNVPIARFRVPWWYRKTFTLPSNTAGRQIWLYFKGINYSANIWLNGKQIADSADVVGPYRDFEFNVTDAVARPGTHVLAVEVLPPNQNEDLAITFVDWAPQPPDQNMGVWQDVEIRTSGPVAIRHPYIISDFDVKSPTEARLTILVDLVNPTDQSVDGTLECQVEQIQFAQGVVLAPHETKTVMLPSQLIAHPRLWWPWHLGKPEMYELRLVLTVNGVVSDRSSTRFGIRKVTSRLQNGPRLFTVNGVDLLILGAGYAGDLLQRRVLADQLSWQEENVRYARDMNLNTLRLEGMLEDDNFYEICDRYGMLVMAGWCCCSPWEQWENWKDEQHTVAYESQRTQIRRLRTHPSLLVWLNGSDNHPPSDVERRYLAIENELKWPCPTISSATAKKSAVSERTGVKMEGPYKWEPPIYWYVDKKKGGAWGFNTEVGPGAVPPPLESLQKMLPPDHRWPIDDLWDFHCGRGKFKKMTEFTDALDARFGKSQGIADFAWKSQAQAYETIRAMFEAFRRNKFTEATGHIQWMLNNAWPSMIWHLYDYYWRPGGAYFATKIACRPLHVLYAYDNRGVTVVNETLKSFENLTVTAEVYDIDAKLKDHQTATCAVGASGSSTLFSLPEFGSLSTTYFFRLRLADASKRVVSLSTYWLSTKPDVLSDESKSDNDWTITRCASYADYTALEKLRPVNLAVGELRLSDSGAEHEARVAITNPTTTIAFMVRAKLTRGDGGEEVLPIQWEDNYFTLLPGETREVSARYFARDLNGSTPAVTADCFNNGRG